MSFMTSAPQAIYYRAGEQKEEQRLETLTFAGVDVNKITLRRVFYSKTMLTAYALLAVVLVGIYELFELRAKIQGFHLFIPTAITFC